MTSEPTRSSSAAIPMTSKYYFWSIRPWGETSEEAREKHRRMVAAPAFVEASLASSGTTSDIDFSQFDLDQPLPSRLTTNGEQGSLDKFQQWGSGKTLRQLASERFG